MKKMTRKEFLMLIATPLLVLGFGKFITACSDSSSSEKGDPDCLNAGTKVSISDNHGHQLTVSKEDVIAGVQKTYSIQGSAGHDHQVTLTPSHFTQLAATTTITIMSTNAGHVHDVDVSCALA